MANIYKRGRMWWIGFRSPTTGKWKYESLETSIEETARTMLGEIESGLKQRARVLEANGVVARTPQSVSELAERVDRYWKFRISDQSRYQRAHAIASWTDFNGDGPTDAIDPDSVLDFQDALLERENPLSPRTINDRIKLLRITFNLARKRKWLDHPNPFADCPPLPVVETAVPWLQTKAEIDHLLDAARHDTFNGWIFVAQCLLAGMRKREAVNSRWPWYHFDRSHVQVTSENGFSTKNRKNRTVPIRQDLAEILEPYAQPDGYLIAPDKTPGNYYYRFDIRKTFERIVDAARMPWVTPKTLRHTFASQLVSNGVELYKVQQWLGHSDPRTTQIYAHLRPADDDVNRF